MSVLERFHAEVLDRGGEAILPRNLSDHWLGVLAKASEELLGEVGQEGPPGSLGGSHEDMNAIVVAAILAIVSAKEGGQSEIRLSWDELHDYLTHYCLELSLELVHRNTEVQYEQATLETILTDRDVLTWRLDAPPRKLR